MKPLRLAALLLALALALGPAASADDPSSSNEDPASSGEGANGGNSTADPEPTGNETGNGTGDDPTDPPGNETGNGTEDPECTSNCTSGGGNGLAPRIHNCRVAETDPWRNPLGVVRLDPDGCYRYMIKQILRDVPVVNNVMEKVLG